MAELTVEQMVSLNPYNPDILVDLEEFVREQVSTEKYSLDANLALLRLYKFEPEKMNIEIVSLILIKALMALPTLDFSLCLNLISQNVQQEEPIATLSTLAQLLEGAQFREFWDAAARFHSVLEAVPGFDASIQNYAVHVLSISYQNVPKDVLAEVVNINGPSLDSYLETQKATKNWSWNNDSQIIELPKNKENHPELRRNVADSISLETVSRLFPILT